jgi:osmotically-inducible protein OsmY
MRSRGALLTGLGIGTGLMFFLDPARGRRRRALVRDKTTHWARVCADTFGAKRRDAEHRATGLAARVRSALNRAERVDDDVLVDRVRAQLGRMVSHPRAIDVGAVDGVVRLSGQILRAETDDLVRAIERIPGVRQVVPQLEQHDDAGNVPSLQGGRTFA